MKNSRPQILKFDSHGFSLIEVLVSIFIVGIMGLIIAQLSRSGSVAFQGLEKNQNMSDSFEKLKLVLKNNKACQANLTQGSGVGLDQDLPFGFRSYNSDTKVLDADSFLAVGMENRGVLVKKIEILDKIPLGEATRLVEVRVTYTIQLAGNEQDYTRSLPLTVILNSGRITDCWLRKDNRAMLTSQICLSMTDGALNAVDPVTGECILAGGKWYSGTFNSASCPNDAVLPASANSNYNCNVNLSGPFSDNFPAVDIPMSDGTTISQHRPTFRRILDKANKQCTCDWASDLPASSYAGAVCQIYCVAP